VGVDVVQDESLPGARYARGADRFLLSEIDVELVEPGTPARKLALSMATVNDAPPAVPSSTTDPGYAAACGDRRRPADCVGHRFGEARDPFLAVRFAEPVRTTTESRIIVTLRHESELRRAVIGRFRLALAADAFSWPPVADAGRRARSNDAKGARTWASGLPEDVMRALRRPAEDRDEPERTALRDYRIWSSPDTAPDYAGVQQIQTERGLLDASIPRVLTTTSVDPAVTRVLPRGNWMDDSAPIVEPAIPRFLGALDTRASGRRGSTWRTGWRRVTIRSPRARSSTVHGVSSSVQGCRKRSTTWAPRESGQRIRSCSTGWHRSSCTPSSTPRPRTTGTCGTSSG
jgi:hypothetical protein